MKKIFNLKSGLLFLITAGLPIIGIAMGIAVEVFLIEQSNGAPYNSSDVGVNIFMGSWLIGFLTFHVWALIAGISLSEKSNHLKVIKWATIIFGLVSLLILLYISLDILYLFLNIVPATESSAGLSAIQTTTDAIIAFCLVCGIWFLPRVLFFSFLAILLCQREGHNRWFSTALQFFFWPIGVWLLQPRLRKVVLGPIDRAVIDHLIEE